MLKGFKSLIISFSSIFFMLPALAKTEVVTSYPYIEDITSKIGKDKVNVTSLAKGDWDPHFIVPRPSLISKTRKADLLIINGAQLEIGWLPPIIRQANNANLQPGSRGFLDLSTFIELIQVPTNISRAQGDVHPFGNPHFNMDPHNITIISKVITEKLCQVDESNCSYYESNNKTFTNQWKEKLKDWDKKLKTLKGSKVIEYHRVFDYIANRYGISILATVEPLPGIPPTPNHLSQIITSTKNDNIRLNLRAVYNPQDPSNYITDKTKIKQVTLPHDVNAVKEATDIFSLFDEIVKRLTE